MEGWRVDRRRKVPLIWAPFGSGAARPFRRWSTSRAAALAATVPGLLLAIYRPRTERNHQQMPLLGLIAGALAVITGVRSFGCPSVSFSGGRLVTVTCLPEGVGAVPGWLAGSGLVVLGLVVAVWSGLALAARR